MEQIAITKTAFVVKGLVAAREEGVGSNNSNTLEDDYEEEIRETNLNIYKARLTISLLI